MTAAVDSPVHHDRCASHDTPGQTGCDCLALSPRWSLACPRCGRPAVWSLGEHGLVCGDHLGVVLAGAWQAGVGFVPPVPVPVGLA